MSKRMIVVFAAAIVALAAHSVEATPIRYVETTSAKGSFGGTTFDLSTVTLTVEGDTSNVTNPSGSLFQNVATTATVDVSGLASATFTDTVQVFSNIFGGGMQGVGFSDLTKGGADIFDVFQPSASAPFLGYNLQTSVGPISAPNDGLNLSFHYSTTAGDFFFTSAIRPFTFEAIVEAPTAAVPEPATLMLLATGVAVGARRYRRK